MSNQLAIIRNPRLIFGDHYPIELHFDAYISEAGAALQVIPWEQIQQILIDADTVDVAQLDHRACWVDTDTPGIIRFVQIAKI